MSTIHVLIDTNANSTFMSDEDSNRMQLAYDKFLMCYTKLCNFWDQSGRIIFTAAPKCHMGWHLMYRSRFLSPRRGACMIDEDFVGHVKAIVQSSTAGAPLHKIATNVASKYRWGRFLLLVHKLKS